LGDILTKEQKAKWLKRSAIAIVEGNFRAARLTGDQRSRIPGDYDMLAADEKTAPDTASAKDIDSAYKLLSETAKKLSPPTAARLTDEQKEAMAKATKLPDEAGLFVLGGQQYAWR